MSRVRLPGLILAGIASVAAVQQSGDAQRTLDEAKALYRDARFAEAVAQLHEVIVAVRPQAHVAEGRELLVDAHLHMALCHVALNSPTAARESFKDMLRLYRSWRLDPAVYAPKVVELFAEARRELATEEPAAAAAEAQPELGAGEEKGGSKTFPILLGVGAAAGVAVAVGGGGGESTGTSSAGTSTTPTPTPTPEVTGSENIALLGVSPAPGSTIALSSGVDLLDVAVSVIYPTDGFYAIFAGIHPGGYVGGDSCIVGATDNFQLSAGQARTVSFRLVVADENISTCPTPFTTDTLTVDLNFEPHIGTPAMRRNFDATYTFQ